MKTEKNCAVYNFNTSWSLLFQTESQNEFWIEKNKVIKEEDIETGLKTGENNTKFHIIYSILV